MTECVLIKDSFFISVVLFLVIVNTCEDFVMFRQRICPNTATHTKSKEQVARDIEWCSQFGK